MEGAYAFTCQLCRARLTLVGSLEAAPGTESAAWVGGRGLLVPQHLQASVFDHSNVDESFIVLDGKRQGPTASTSPHALPPQPLQPPGGPTTQLSHPGQSSLSQQHPQQRGGLDESFVMLGAASVLRPGPPGLQPQPHPHTHTHPHHPSGLSPLHLQALQRQQLAPQQQPPQQPQQPPNQQQLSPGAGAATSPSSAATTITITTATGGGLSPQQPQQQQLPPRPPQSPPSALQPPSLPQSPPQPLLQSHPSLPSSLSSGPGHLTASPPQPSPLSVQRRGVSAGSGAAGPGPGMLAGGGGGAGGPLSSADLGDGGGDGGGGGGASGGTGLDSKLQALARLFELASTNTQVDHPLCMDCVGQLKEEMDTQIGEAEREITAYSSCLAQLEAGMGAGAGGISAGGTGGEGTATNGGATGLGSNGGATGLGSNGGNGSGGGGVPRVARGEAEEYYLLEEISRLEQERDQERARAEVLESELSQVASELASLSSTSTDLSRLEERYWHDVNDFELLLRAHTDERGGLMARIDRAQQRLQLLKNASVLYDAFTIWHDGPFGTISGFRLGRTPEVPVEWDEVNAAWGQAVLLLNTMAQMCKVQFSQHRLLPMGSHPRVADKRSTYDLFGPVYKLWSANYDRAMVGYLACLKEFGEHARRKDAQDGKPTLFNFLFAIDGDKVNNHTIKLTLNKDVRWTKALKFMLANLKIALQWCTKQDQAQEVPQLQHLQQEGPQLLPEH